MAAQEKGDGTSSDKTHLILHEDPISGNSYKIKLTAALLSIPLELRYYSILKGDTKTPEFRENISSFGRIPVLQIGTSTFLPESNAVCFYLADAASSLSSAPHFKLIPQNTIQRAEVLRWLFFEQNQVEINLGMLRNWLYITGKHTLDPIRLAQIEGKTNASKEILNCMEDHLTKSEHGWFVGEDITLADVCLFAYTHNVHDIGFDLQDWPAVTRWCDQVKGVENFIEMN